MQPLAAARQTGLPGCSSASCCASTVAQQRRAPRNASKQRSARERQAAAARPQPPPSTSAQRAGGAPEAPSSKSRSQGLLSSIAPLSSYLRSTSSRDGDNELDLQLAQQQSGTGSIRRRQAAAQRTEPSEPLPLASSEDASTSSSGSAVRLLSNALQYIPKVLRTRGGSSDDDGPVSEDEEPFSGAPILSCAGGGIFFFWELGVVKYLSEKYDLSKVDLVGASAGGLVSTLAACGVDADTAVKAAYRLSVANGVFERPAGLAGIWGRLIREWLDELLPDNAAELCSGRVRLVVTEMPSLRLAYLSKFESKEDLINANMASVHIPFFLDGNATFTYRGKAYIDGSLWDFLQNKNSDLLQCGGKACIVDYFEDRELSRNRLSFLELADYDTVLKFVRAGVAFAQRQDAAGAYEATLGSVRKSRLRRAVELPVRVVSDVVRQAVV